MRVKVSSMESKAWPNVTVDSLGRGLPTYLVVEPGGNVTVVEAGSAPGIGLPSTYRIS